jgi:hypothetical protein
MSDLCELFTYTFSYLEVSQFTLNEKMAGSVGIEPTSSVLETGVMPLYELPIRLKGQYSIYLINESKNGGVGGSRTHGGISTSG